ncbi:Mov34/MPN/PAD-1 family protein [Nocardioides aquiterrae]|uniref:Mov34/MPN/PAD-1 family protein n=1 Tax=Nocardioides aquiterrae TaxID=203799 RepID=A0ABN1UGK9_9ACTN
MPALFTRLSRRRELLRIPAHLLQEAVAEGWSKWPLETGGILLGKPGPDGHVVTDLIGPGPEGRHERYGFTPDSDWQAEQVAARWATDSNLHYLGDWHTHPGGSTRLSRLDRSTARDIAAYEEARQPNPFMLVLALGRDQTVRVGAARLINDRLRRVVVHPH